jgi:hypothetical protein
MPSDRTLVTELATALGMVGVPTIEAVLASRPESLSSLDDATWSRLRELHASGAHADGFASGFANGQAFLEADEALAGRIPRRIEWTGGHKLPGDEAVPLDLRVDHVYLVSCKYLSRVLQNAGPARLAEGLLTFRHLGDRRDWYERVAPVEYQALYRAAVDALGVPGFPALVTDLDVADRKRLSPLLDGRTWPDGTQDQHREFCRAVSEGTARIWRRSLQGTDKAAMLWRLLRIGSAPYFVLGSDGRDSMRLRVDTPWDWRQNYRLENFEVEPQDFGQPRVGWGAGYVDLRGGSHREVRGHIELRWSHGRFRQPPEAKVYLDSPHVDVPGYNRMSLPGASHVARQGSLLDVESDPADPGARTATPLG